MAADFADATRDYARWLAGYLALDPAGLAEKRRKMDKKKVFPFLRGTFYRWRHHLAAAPRAVQEAPAVLAAGDVHLENFGTWRDAEGRLAWGLNDFDEAAELPFASDLVRLAASLVVEHRDDGAAAVGADPEAGIAAVEAGYREALAGGRPFVLEEAGPGHAALRRAALAGFDPEAAWAKIRADGEPGRPDELDLLHLLLTTLPSGARPLGFRRTQKGLGSLGRARWAVLAEWNGGPLAREAKATAPSAALMPARPASRVTDHRRIVAEARRAPDPGFLVTERWVVRRLSPEARKLELAALAPDPEAPAAPAGATAEAGPLALLRAMGAELANLHAGTARDPAALAAWLGAQPVRWLRDAATAAADRVAEDHGAFRRDPGVVEEAPPPAAP